MEPASNGFGLPQGQHNDVDKALGQLVLTLADVLRQLMERAAGHRMESGSLSEEEIERLGLALMRLDERMVELRRTFGLDERELDVRIQTAEGHEVSLVELADRLINKGLAVHGQLAITLADVPLVNLTINVAVATPR